MKKISKILQCILLVALLAACSKDDENLQVPSQPQEIAQTIELEANLNEALLLQPRNIQANAQCEWFVNGELVASTLSYNFVSNQTGETEVLLKITEGEMVRSLRYNIFTLKSLASELNNFTLNASNGVETLGGYYWNQTYADTKFQTANFTFSHTGGVVTGYNYWDGFTVSNSTDNTDHGAPGESEGWIPYQWGSMPTSTPANNGNFLVGYWGYYMLDYKHPIEEGFDESYFATWVKLGNDTKAHILKDIKIAMHPWPYYGILHGDGFARPFKKGDYFKLIVHGVDANNNFIWKKDVFLSDYRNSDNGNNYGVNEWIEFKNPKYFKKIKYLVFQMETTDAHPEYGPNTAVYFCIGDIRMR